MLPKRKLLPADTRDMTDEGFALWYQDQMGCVHHSNYIRRMEEARVNLMAQMGCGYKSMEASGIMNPVLEVHCQYRSMVRFDDHVEIHVWVKEYNAIRMTLAFEMHDTATGELKTTGESRHCFLDTEGRPVSLKRSYPQWDTAFRNAVRAQDARQ